MNETTTAPELYPYHDKELIDLSVGISEFHQSVDSGEFGVTGYQDDPHDNIFLEAESHFDLDF